MTNQFDLFASREARDAGIESVATHNEDWMENCMIAYETFSRINPEFTGEDVRRYCESLGLHPKHHNAWGAFINSLVRRGAMIATGNYRQMQDKRSHARRTPLYKGRYA
jgi:hypothetical protein